MCRGGVALKLICRLTCWLKADTPRHTQAHTPTHTHSRTQHRQQSKQTNKRTTKKAAETEAVAVFIRAHFAFYQALRIRHVRRPGHVKVPLCVGVSTSVCCV